VSEEQVRELIKAEIARAGSLRKLAAEWGVSIAYLSDCTTNRRAPGPSILKHMGIERRVEVTYTRSN
jgi:hypothetical protein